MRKFIGRSVATAALAAATVLPLAGMASATPQAPAASSNGDHHGRHHHGRHHHGHHCHHNGGYNGFNGFGGFGGYNGFGGCGYDNYGYGFWGFPFGLLGIL